MSSDPNDNSPVDEAFRGIVRHFHELLKKRLDAADNALLEAHFLLEERLNELLTDLALQPDRVNLGLEFAVKVKTLRAFAPLGDNPLWELIEAINALRNRIAHPKD